MLSQEAYNRSDFGSGFALATSRRTGATLAVFRLLPNVKLDATYDTGNPGDDLSPTGFALQGSEEARGNGVFGMQSSQASLATDIQVPSVTAQVFMDIQSVGFDELEFRQIYGRVGNLLGGDYYSSFTDSGTLPQTIVPMGNVAGSIQNPKTTQLQYSRLFGIGLLISAAIENPNTEDYTLVATDDTRLSRIPDFVARVRYQPLDAWGSVQGAILVRHFIFEDTLMNEHHTSAVSFSGNARFKTWGDNNVRLGGVAGEGAGGRIFGLNGAQVAAGPLAGSLNALENVGGFASYQHFWLENLWSNVAYGYAFADVTAAMGDQPRRSQNGWVNLIWNNSSGNVAFGVEYQVGQLEVGDGRHGFNHHIQLSMQIGGAVGDPEDEARAVARRRRSQMGAAAAPSSPTDVFPRL